MAQNRIEIVREIINRTLIRRKGVCRLYDKWFLVAFFKSIHLLNSSIKREQWMLRFLFRNGTETFSLLWWSNSHIHFWLLVIINYFFYVKDGTMLYTKHLVRC